MRMPRSARTGTRTIVASRCRSAHSARSLCIGRGGVPRRERPYGVRVTEPRIAAVVVNPVKVDLDALKAAVASAAADAGWAESLWFETSVEDVGQGVTRQALAAGADMVIA